MENDVSTTALMNQTPKIACLPNGPYYFSMTDRGAGAEPAPRQRRAVRHGAGRGAVPLRGSRNKPFCDGTHSLIGFKDQRSANATPNRRESYAGRRITIHDNRASAPRRFLHRPTEVGLPDARGALDRCRWRERRRDHRDDQEMPLGRAELLGRRRRAPRQEREPAVTVTNDGPYAITGGSSCSA